MTSCGLDLFPAAGLQTQSGGLGSKPWQPGPPSITGGVCPSYKDVNIIPFRLLLANYYYLNAIS